MKTLVDIEFLFGSLDTLETKYKKAIKYVKEWNCIGLFDHKEIQLIVYDDSTIRELQLQYKYKKLKRSHSTTSTQ